MARRPAALPRARGEQYDEVAPLAASLVQSLRAFSYELPSAVADLIDNSITAGARHVWIDFFWDGDDSAISVTDDGRGMSEDTLKAAMRLGSASPQAPRAPRDLGRFGLGLKTASFSQARQLTVASKESSGREVARCWDLDHVIRTNAWQLIRGAAPRAEQHLARFRALDHGTAVVWQTLDRLVDGQQTGNEKSQNLFLHRADGVSRHLSMVFHELMQGRHSVQLVVNDVPLVPWDPFLETEPATQQLPATRLRLRDQTVTVRPFILPHHSKLSDPSLFEAAKGPRGWNAQQGFYIYRGQRLLVPGDWLGLGWIKEDHFKLARIRVDVPNALDHDWAIDVTKSRALPPPALRDELRAIGDRVRQAAKRVYTYRGARLSAASDAARIFLWEPYSQHGQVGHRINRDHPLVARAMASATERSQFTALLRLLEETVPTQHITIQNSEAPTSLRGPFDHVAQGQIRSVMTETLRALREAGCTEREAATRLRAIWPFELYPQLLDTLVPHAE